LKIPTLALSGATAILNAIMMANPIPIFVGALMTLVAVFGLSRAAAGGFSETLSEVFSYRYIQPFGVLIRLLRL